MNNKRKISPQEYRIYIKQHDYDDVVATEESKISNEKETCATLQVKGKQRLQQKIRLLINIDDPDLLEDDLEIPDEEIIANRKIRNARTHKNRLYGLKIYEE